MKCHWLHPGPPKGFQVPTKCVLREDVDFMRLEPSKCRYLLSFLSFLSNDIRDFIECTTYLLMSLLDSDIDVHPECNELRIGSLSAEEILRTHNFY